LSLFFNWYAFSTIYLLSATWGKVEVVIE
jgi:hypothetical protein